MRKLIAGSSGLTPTEAQAISGLQPFTGKHRLADEVGLGGRNHAGKAEIAGCHRSVDLGTGDMTLFDAHDAERFGTVGADAVLFTSLHDPVSPERTDRLKDEIVCQFSLNPHPEVGHSAAPRVGRLA